MTSVRSVLQQTHRAARKDFWIPLEGAGACSLAGWDVQKGVRKSGWFSFFPSLFLYPNNYLSQNFWRKWWSDWNCLLLCVAAQLCSCSLWRFVLRLKSRQNAYLTVGCHRNTWKEWGWWKGSPQEGLFLFPQTRTIISVQFQTDLISFILQKYPAVVFSLYPSILGSYRHSWSQPPLSSASQFTQQLDHSPSSSLDSLQLDHIFFQLWCP